MLKWVLLLLILSLCLTNIILNLLGFLSMRCTSLRQCGLKMCSVSGTLGSSIDLSGNTVRLAGGLVGLFMGGLLPVSISVFICCCWSYGIGCLGIF